MIKNNIYIFLAFLIVLIYGIAELFYPERFPFLDNVIGWLVALFVAINYLQKNRRDNQIAKKEEFKKTLEIEAFREITKEIYRFSNLLSNISAYYLNTKNQVHLYKKYPDIQKIDKVKIDFEINQQIVNILNGISNFILVIESNEISLIQFDHFRKFIQFRTEDIKELILEFQKYFWEKTILSDESIFEIDKKCDEVANETYNLQSYLFDYRIEIMNSLIGDFFNKNVPRRKPLDPQYKLLTEVATIEEVEKESKKREAKYSKSNA